jgi:hypothetical protein
MTHPCPPCGDGGNTTIHNQDEAEILARVTSGVPTRAEGYQEDDSHVHPVHRERNVAGS